MISATRGLVASLFAGFFLAGCGGSTEPAKEPAPEPAAPAPSAAPSAGEGTSLTAEACAASGGTVVGDIGDGAIHRPDYKCASGAKPTGRIRAAEGGPVAIEGSVCCPK